MKANGTQVAPNLIDSRIGCVGDQLHHQTSIIVVAGKEQIDREMK
jgi:hypothetical protein